MTEFGAKRRKIVSEYQSTDLLYMKINARILRRIRASNLVKPCNLTEHWHALLCEYVRCFLVGGYAANIIIALIFFQLFLLMELYLRIKQRFLQLDCAYNQNNYNQYRPMETYSTFELPKLDASATSIYEEHFKANNIFSTKLFWLEFKDYLNFNNVKSFFIYHTSVAMGSLWAVLYPTLYVFSHLDRFVWLNQIQRQIKDCTSEIGSLKRMIQLQGAKNIVFHETKRNRAIFQDVTVAYINLELFRRSQVKFKQMASFLLLQGSAISGITLSVAYVTNTFINPSSKVLNLTLAMYIIGVTNVFLDTGALLTHKLDKLRSDISNLLAASKCSSLEFNFMIDLWSR